MRRREGRNKIERNVKRNRLERADAGETMQERRYIKERKRKRRDREGKRKKEACSRNGV
jgi:hypothetical protein